MAHQRISSGFPLPVYIDETRTKQSLVIGVFVDQTSPAAVNVNLVAAASTGAVAAFSKEVDGSVSLIAAASTGAVASFGPGNSINLVAASSTAYAAPFVITGKKGFLLLLGCGT